MKKNLLEINLADTRVTGLFGYPVEHSLSPVMHNTAFDKIDINYLYLPFAIKPDNLEAAVTGIKGLNLEGVNLTIPHKEQVIPYLDELAEEARLIGAVNTIENRDGKLIGHNTDGIGFIRSLKEEVNFRPKGKKALIIGAGGAARAIAFQLGLEGINELYISNRTLEKAESLAQEVEDKLELVKVEAVPLITEDLKEITAQLDLLVDTTPVGMYPKLDVEPVISQELLHQDLIVSDLVYNPIDTTLLQAAREVGAQTVSGLGMLLYQGAIAFEIWTGKEAPIDTMREALKSGMGKDK